MTSYQRHTKKYELRNLYPFTCIQGPALYACNNSKFTKEDWRGIRLVCDSIKVEDPMKVGRFGLGFKSVFHMRGNAKYLPSKPKIKIVFWRFFFFIGCVTCSKNGTKAWRPAICHVSVARNHLDVVILTTTLH